MNYLTRREDPFELLFKNFFEGDSFFTTINNCEMKYPVDIYETDKTLEIEIAAVGISEDDIDIKLEEGNILRVSYEKESPTQSDNASEKEPTYIHKGIARRSFNMGWKIGQSFDIENLEASLDKGLLKITIPSAPKVEPKKIDIKVPHKELK